MAFLKNINAWKQKSDSAKKRIRSRATDYVQKKVFNVYMETLRISPQWSGNYVYNWQLDFTGFTGTSYDRRFKVQEWQTVRPNEHKAGDPEAINAAISFAKSQIQHIKWNSKIKLVNHAPVADMIENGEVKLRPENLIPGGEGVIAYLETKYGNYFQGK